MDDMPYTMATIFEVLRYSSSPIVPHVATEDTQIAGYGVTSGSIVFINNYALNMNNKYWNSPDTFYPERFLEEKSKRVATSSKFYESRRSSEESDSGIEFEKDAGIYHDSNKYPNIRRKDLGEILNVESDPHRFQLKKYPPFFTV